MIKNLFQLISSGAAAQAISLIIMPIITRLHSPESLGQYQFFTTLALVIAPFFSGGFAFAIKSSSSLHVALTTLKTAVYFSIIFLLSLILISPIIILILKINNLSWFIPYLIFLLIQLFVSVNLQFGLAFLNFNRQYSLLSKLAITKSISQNSLKLGFSLMNPHSLSLILPLIIADLIQALRLVKPSNLKFILRFKYKKFKKDLLRLRVFPTFVAPTSSISIILNWFPILVTASLYGDYYAGMLGLVFMSLNTPTYPIIDSLKTLCYGEFKNPNNLKQIINIYSKSMLIAAIPSLLGIVILYFYAEPLFGFVFGKKWEPAGLYALICFIPISLSFMLSPVYSTLSHFYSFQQVFLWINLFCLILASIITTYIAFKAYDFWYFLISFSVIISINHIVQFIAAVLLTLNRIDTK